MKTSEILTKARELIDSPDKWTQGALARLPDGSPLTEEAKPAACFCSYGAVRRATAEIPPDERDWQRHNATVALGKQTGESLGGHDMFSRRCLIKFNDNSNHDAVLAMFDRAIADSQSKGD